jgi:DNA-directed RNA polymerase specialized sigma24 family protein
VRASINLHQLHERLVAGDPTAPSLIFTDVHPRLLRFIKAATGSGVEIDDVESAVADALLVYFRLPSAFDPTRSTLTTWLLAVAKFKLKTLVRSRKRRNSRASQATASANMEVFGITASSKGEEALLAVIDGPRMLDRYGGELIKDEGDLEVFLLMAAGAKDEPSFVEALQLTGTAEQNRKEVRRRRDLIRKRAERLGKKFSG